MADRIYQLTEIEDMVHDYEPDEYDEKEMPTITYNPSTPSIMSENILSVRERADHHFKRLESKDVSSSSPSYSTFYL